MQLTDRSQFRAGRYLSAGISCAIGCVTSCLELAPGPRRRCSAGRTVPDMTGRAVAGRCAGQRGAPALALSQRVPE